MPPNLLTTAISLPAQTAVWPEPWHEYDLPMTEAAERFLRSFKALPKPDQHDVLVSLLRQPLEADYLAPSDDELMHAAEQVFLALDQAEQSQ